MDRLRRAWHRGGAGYALVFPSMLLFAVFFIYPVLHTGYLSFFQWNLSGTPRFDGFGRYVELFSDDLFIKVLSNTLFYSVATVFFTLTGGLLLALALNRNTKLAAFLQGSIFTSYIVSWVGVSLLWLWLLDPQYGFINLILSWFSIDPVRWLGDPSVALWTLVAITVWKTVGYDMIIYLAALQSIPKDLHEAAAIDGAGPTQRFLHITLPQLKPTTLFLLVTTTMMTFQAFDIIKVMTQGGPVDATSIYVYYVYERAFELAKIGVASAAVVVFLAILALITFVQFRVLDRGSR